MGRAKTVREQRRARASKRAVRPPTVATIRARLRPLANPRIAGPSQQFFKTSPGEYGYGDRFLGIRVPTLRSVAREFRGAPLAGGARAAAFAAARGAAPRIVHPRRPVTRAARRPSSSASTSSTCKHVPRHVNNWDLVDSSAHYIVGAHLEERDRGVLYELARSPHLWSRRVAIIATFWFIKRGSFTDTLRIAELLLDDERGSHPQGRRLDAARGRQPRRSRRGAVPAAPLPPHAADDAALRDREAPRADARAYLTGTIR